MTKIKEIIFNLMYIMIIIYLLVFVPCIWGHKPLMVISGSMEPTLKIGSLLYYHKENVSDLNKNDILVFESKSHIISHRIVDITETGFIVKGDANRSIDFNEVKNNQVLGKGTNWCIPLLGFYADFIYTHKYLLYISITILIIDMCNEHYQKKKKDGILYEKGN